MADLTSEAIARATGAPLANVRETWPLVLAEMQRWNVASLSSQIGMAATIAVETGVTVRGKNLTFLPIPEQASGAAYDTGRLAVRLGNTPDGDGDGQRYKGRGLIQTTGQLNYRKFEDAEGLPVVANPDLLLQPGPAALAAVFYWRHKDLARYCDAGQWEQVRRRVNGGLNGWDRFIQLVRRLQAPAEPRKEA